MPRRDSASWTAVAALALDAAGRGPLSLAGAGFLASVPLECAGLVCHRFEPRAPLVCGLILRCLAACLDLRALPRVPPGGVFLACGGGAGAGSGVEYAVSASWVGRSCDPPSWSAATRASSTPAASNAEARCPAL